MNKNNKLPALIITGPPKIGKSTILEKVIANLIKKNKCLLGCVVKEIKEQNNRIGFDLCFLPSNKTMLMASSKQNLSNQKIGKFSVSINTIENYLIQQINAMSEDQIHDVLVFDEIGRMQNLSHKFLPAIDMLMKSKKPLIATIVNDDEIWARKYKNNSQNFVITANESNRDFIPILIDEIISSTDDMRLLNQCYIKNILELFNRLLKHNQQQELLKLFKRTVKYLAYNRATYNIHDNNCFIKGETALRTVTYNNNIYQCTCQFHNHGKRQCSHIQTFSVIKACYDTIDIQIPTNF